MKIILIPSLHCLVKNFKYKVPMHLPQGWGLCTFISPTTPGSIYLKVLTKSPHCPRYAQGPSFGKPMLRASIQRVNLGFCPNKHLKNQTCSWCIYWTVLHHFHMLLRTCRAVHSRGSCLPPPPPLEIWQSDYNILISVILTRSEIQKQNQHCPHPLLK